MAKGADVLVHEAMYVPAVESYVKDQVAKGRPVSVEAFMAHMKADHSPVEERRPYRRGRRSENPRVVAPNPRHRQYQ